MGVKLGNYKINNQTSCI